MLPFSFYLCNVVESLTSAFATQREGEESQASLQKRLDLLKFESGLSHVLPDNWILNYVHDLTALYCYPTELPGPRVKHGLTLLFCVIPAKAGIQSRSIRLWP